MGEARPDRPILRSLLGGAVRVIPAGVVLAVYRLLVRFAWTRRIVNRALRATIPGSVRIPEGVLFLNRDDPAISAALAMGAYERRETELFRRLVRPGMTVLDVGANLGLYTVIAARLAGPSGRVVAFEPSAENAALLRRNVEGNGLAWVVCERIALSDREGEVRLHVSAENKGEHTILPGVIEEAAAETVPTTTLDRYLEGHGIGRVDLVKIDIQGAEPIVLDGMRETLATLAPALFVEFYPHGIRKAGRDPLALLATLASHGYSLSHVDQMTGEVRPVGDPDRFVRGFRGGAYTNLLCLRREDEAAGRPIR